MKTKDIVIIGISFLGFVIVVIGIIILAKKFLTPSETKDYKKDVDEKKLTYTDSQYQTFASALFRAFNGIGTDEDTVYRNLGYLKNKDDFNKLVSVYGVDEDDFTLPARLIYELDQTELQKVNNILGPINIQI